jgi:hypothetical protein
VSDLEDDLRAAMGDEDEVDATSETESEVVHEGSEETTEETTSITADDLADNTDSDPTVDNAVGADATTSTDTTESLKAPINYSPAAREQWSKVPETVKKQILDRESHVAQAMEKTAHSNRYMQAAEKMSQQHANTLQAEGMQNPLEAADAYMQTVASSVTAPHSNVRRWWLRSSISTAWTSTRWIRRL